MRQLIQLGLSYRDDLCYKHSGPESRKKEDVDVMPGLTHETYSLYTESISHV